VHHDNPEREYADDNDTEAVLQLAIREGWCVISMKNDWKTVFPKRNFSLQATLPAVGKISNKPPWR
jgi:hypothetical protein